MKGSPEKRRSSRGIFKLSLSNLSSDQQSPSIKSPERAPEPQKTISRRNSRASEGKECDTPKRTFSLPMLDLSGHKTKTSPRWIFKDDKQHKKRHKKGFSVLDESDPLWNTKKLNASIFESLFDAPSWELATGEGKGDFLQR